ncbi:helix-turn-helix transcriptional regulator [Granulicella sp. 5B5]|uniref:helix-turn-helix domain-containing protein n=1 Tax=Granulicella sp. 5B5 TaxID=1617967 RepID=UPI0031FCB098
MIVSLREHAKLSQELLAERAGVHRTYISQLERNLKSPTVETLTKIAFALGHKASRLLQLMEGDFDEL